MGFYAGMTASEFVDTYLLLEETEIEYKIGLV